MTDKNACRIGKVRMKNGGVQITVIPRAPDVETYQFPGGEVTIRTSELCLERKLFLLEQAQRYLWALALEETE